MRSVDMQIWPWFMKAPNTAASTACAISASDSTISAALLPNSSSAGFRCWPASLPMILPVAVDPVKFTRRTLGSAMSFSTMAGASPGALLT